MRRITPRIHERLGWKVMVASLRRAGRPLAWKRFGPPWFSLLGDGRIRFHGQMPARRRLLVKSALLGAAAAARAPLPPRLHSSRPHRGGAAPPARPEAGPGAVLLGERLGPVEGVGERCRGPDAGGAGDRCGGRARAAGPPRRSR